MELLFGSCIIAIAILYTGWRLEIKLDEIYGGVNDIAAYFWSGDDDDPTREPIPIEYMPPADLESKTHIAEPELRDNVVPFRRTA